MVAGASYFKAHIDEGSSPTRVIAEGELDAASAESLAGTLSSAHELARGVSLDLAGVTFIDSSGLRIVAAELRRSSETGDPFAITAASVAVRRIFAVTGLDALIPS